MKKLLFLLFLPVIMFSQTSDDELVNPKELIPDIVIDLRYSTKDHSFLNLPSGNISLPKFYTVNECLVLGMAVRRLKVAQDSLRKILTHNGLSYPQGIGIKVWDGYRPRAVQWLFWEIYPNSTYIADPSSGSKHNRGGAIDMTLVNLATGEELAMPTLYDDFSDQASQTYTNLPPNIIANRLLLKTILNYAGFTEYEAEWWHYEIPYASSYPLLDFQTK